MAEEKKVSSSRRGFVSTAVAGIVGVIGGFAGGYFSAPKGEVKEIIKEVPKEVIKEVPVGVLILRPGLTADDERAIIEATRVVKDNKLEGTTINVVIAEGTAEQFNWMLPAWESATKTKVQMIPIPFAELAKKAATEMVTKGGAYDLITTPDEFIGDWVEGGLAKDIRPYMDKYQPNLYGWPGRYLDNYNKIARYMDIDYQWIWDGCEHTPYYRRDYLEDPKEQENFEAEFGYPLPVKGADTWEQLADMMKFFDRPSEPGGKNEKLTGQLGMRGGWIMFTRWEICAHHYMRLISKGGLPFGDNMNALINSKESVTALEDMKKIMQYMPEITTTGTWTEIYADYPAGKAFYGETWVSLNRYNTIGSIKGQHLSGKMPGSMVNGKLIRVSMRILTSSYFVSNYSKNPELSYLFMQYFQSPRISGEAIKYIGFWDPTRDVHIEKYDLGKIFADTAEHGMENIRNVAFNIEHTCPFLLFERTGEYLDAYNAACHSYITGAISSAQEALNLCKEQWEKTTESVGRDKQLKQWNYLKKYFPKDIAELHGWEYGRDPLIMPDPYTR